MPQPTMTAVHYDRPLTNISIAYIQDTTTFIADQVFPTIPVDKASDLYYTYTKNDWFRDEAQQRAPGTESAGSGYGLSPDSYSTKTYAFHKDVPDKLRANADAGLDLDRDAVEFVTQRLLLKREIVWAANYFTTSKWGTDITGAASASAGYTVYWNDYTNSNPIKDVDTGSRTIKIATGFNPNTLVLGYDVFLALRNHPLFLDRVKYTSPESITTDVMARYFFPLGTGRVIVAQAIYATNLEGETAAYSFVHGKNALLCYTAPRPGLLTPSAGYTFAWTGVSGGMGKTVAIKSFPMQWTESTRVEGEMAFDLKLIATDLGYFFSGIVQ